MNHSSRPKHARSNHSDTREPSIFTTTGSQFVVARAEGRGLLSSTNARRTVFSILDEPEPCKPTSDLRPIAFESLEM
jgi:hypothetical protein